MRGHWNQLSPSLSAAAVLSDTKLGVEAASPTSEEPPEKSYVNIYSEVEQRMRGSESAKSRQNGSKTLSSSSGSQSSSEGTVILYARFSGGSSIGRVDEYSCSETERRPCRYMRR